MGQAVDAFTIDKQTLALRKRNVKQGPATIQLAFTDGKVDGTMNIGAGDRPVSAALSGPLLAEALPVIAALPVEPRACALIPPAGKRIPWLFQTSKAKRCRHHMRAKPVVRQVTGYLR